MCDVLKIYGVGWQLLDEIKTFYKEASVRVNGEIRELFDICVGVWQRCVVSPWLFNIYTVYIWVV